MVETKLVSTKRMNEKGQAMIEYVLLLVITVSMVLLALANVFKPIQGFLQNYMGTYVACLLSSGELPAIRTENGLKDNDPKCNFSIAMNQSTGNSGGSGPTSTNPNSTDPNTSNNKRNGGSSGSNSSSKGSGGARSGSGNGSDYGNDSGAGANSYAGSRSRNSGFGKSAFLRRSSDGLGSDGGGIGSEGKKRYVNNLDRNKNDKYFRAQENRTPLGGRYGRGVAISGMTEDEQQKIERKIQSEPRTIPQNSSEDFSVPGKKTTLKPPPEKQKIKIEEKDAGFTLGNFFKYIMIAVILLLILILGGGQVFEMSKTME